MVDPDIAFNKPATASSTWDNKDYYKPVYLTNGLADCDADQGPIAHTGRNDPAPWFRVDLRGKFYIRTVIVNPRTSKYR